MQFRPSVLIAISSILFPIVSANVYCTSPVSATTWSGNSSDVVTWEDDGDLPTLTASYRLDIELWVGDQTTQFLLDTLATNVSSDAYKKTITIDPTLGPDASDYFFRFHETGSLNRTADVFSSMFSLTKMTGSFNATILSDLASLSITGTSASTAVSSSSKVTTTTKSASSGVTTTALVLSASSPASSAGASSDTSGASSITSNAFFLLFVGMATLAFGMVF